MPPLLVDTHCHLAWPDFDADRDEVVRRARDAGVVAAVLVAVDAASAEEVATLAARHPDWGHPTAGIHPSEGALADPEQMAALADLLDSGRFCAVGETGLDAFHERTPLGDQRRALEAQLALALERDLPVVLHCRDAFAGLREVLDVHRGAGLRGVLHCFTGDASDLEFVLAAGLHVGLGGLVTFKPRADLRELARRVPRERLLLETDAPWLAPVPHRGRRNEPAFVAHVAEVLATVRGEELEGLAERCSRNAAALFGFDLAGS
ncbi:MAG: TatD family hydrolase [Planctomycetes bacterium]|nr:TatD family hydrolase [Planctomycetota bacterium]